MDFKRLHETVDTCFSEDFINIIEKRCIDAAAANVGLNVHFHIQIMTRLSENQNGISKHLMNILNYLLIM